MNYEMSGLAVQNDWVLALVAKCLWKHMLDMVT